MSAVGWVPFLCRLQALNCPNEKASGGITFCGEATVGEAHYGLPTRLEHPIHLLEDFKRPCEVVNRHHVCDDIERIVLVGQLGICYSQQPD